jgi:hypothetical protein
VNSKGETLKTFVPIMSKNSGSGLLWGGGGEEPYSELDLLKGPWHSYCMKVASTFFKLSLLVKFFLLRNIKGTVAGTIF